MAYTLDDFDRDSRRHVLERLTPEELRAFLQTLPIEERLRGMSPEEILLGLTAEERLRALTAEECRGLQPQELVRGLTPEELRELKDLVNELVARGDGKGTTESSGS